jgi:hypothetical protein
MKQVQLLMAVLFGTVILAGNARGQILYQRLTFSIFGQYVTNEATTNSINPLTVNETNVLKTVLISSASLVKAMALDFAGANYTNWTGSYLEREINMTNGAEGIFLYRTTAPATNLDVSRYFNLSFSNDFAYEPDLNSHFAGITNYVNTPGYFYPANFSPANNPIVGDNVYVRKTGNITNTWSGSGLYYVEFYTTNLAFNLLGFGTSTSIDPVEHFDKLPYSNLVSTLEVAGVGTFAVNNATTNGSGVVVTTNYYLISGPAHGSFGTAPPTYTTLLHFEP